MKNKQYLLAAGQFALVLGIAGYVINSFWLNNHPVLAFLSGLMFGLSLVFNTTYLIKSKKKSE